MAAVNRAPRCRHCGALFTGSPYCSQCGAPAAEAGPLRSADGRFWWDGEGWRPLAAELRQHVTHVRTRLVRRGGMRMSDTERLVHAVLIVCTLGLWFPVFWARYNATAEVVEVPIVVDR